MTGKIFTFFALFLTVISWIFFIANIGGGISMHLLYAAVILHCIGSLRGEGG